MQEDILKVEAEKMRITLQAELGPDVFEEIRRQCRPVGPDAKSRQAKLKHGQYLIRVLRP